MFGLNDYSDDARLEREIIRLIVKHLNQIKEPTERVALAQQIFGRRAMEVLVYCHQKGE